MKSQAIQEKYQAADLRPVKWLALVILLAISWQTKAAADSTASKGLVQLQSSGNCGASMLTLNGINQEITRQINWKKDDQIAAVTDIPAPIITVAGGSEGSEARNFRFPLGLFVDQAGAVYVADQYNHRVQKWLPGAKEGITVAGGHNQGSFSNQLDYPYGIVVDKAGNIYVADANNHRVQKWAPGAAEGVTVAGGNGRGAAANQLSFPYGLAIDGEGNLYIADNYNHRIQKWAPGAVNGTTVAGGNGAGDQLNQLKYPNGVAVDAAGNIYVADAMNDRVQYWKKGAVQGQIIAGGKGRGNREDQLYFPSAIWLDENNGLYISDNTNHRIQYWASGATAGITVAGGKGQGTDMSSLRYPYAICLDTKGRLYITDQYNHRVQRYVHNDRIASFSYQAEAAGIYTAELVNVDGSVKGSSSARVDAAANAGNIIGTEAFCVSGKVMFSNETAGGKWVSENPAIASVNELGLVNAYAAGSTMIRYQVKDENGCEAVVSFRVAVNEQPRPVTITGSRQPQEFTELAFSAEVNGGQWSSSDTTVISIGNNGNARALNAGAARIVYEIKGQPGCGLTATADISVMPAMPSVKDTVIVLDPGTGNGGAVQGPVFSLAKGGKWQYYISSGDSLKKVIGVILPRTAGIYTYWVSQIKNGVEGPKAPVKITVKSNPPFTLLVGGNPSVSSFLLKVQTSSVLPVSLRIVDIYGRVVEARNGVQANSNIQVGQQLTSGTYFAEVIQGNERQVVQLIKARA
ncbi:SBBP repeat-containing protein [Sediminibacterium ginsengisoli]|uniref:Por secretion system C-terminal sorting domain-containing protein n=1 Tax=Sediminibacterium ginsengisoli TaxID=413434 RepID=A0A1T4LFH0_9BACT|nr:SBBP repeat-containing protein [Sediminibacterium ginsengisoli]SJZ53423.1 Por secretion system C-terminal sorting domain-containing protein [Sediminibacterium ginsengisoli]